MNVSPSPDESFVSNVHILQSFYVDIEQGQSYCALELKNHQPGLINPFDVSNPFTVYKELS